MTATVLDAPTLTPADEAEVAAAVAEAAAVRRPLRIRGGGTRATLGRPVRAEATLSTARLSAISLYEPQALTLVAGAGARLAEIETMLAAEGQRLPFEPMDHRPLLRTTGEPTLGGAAACNVSGPRRIQAGACRDSLIGVRFVDGRGTVVKNGGRVMKNVTGYDLVKLMAGSLGTLGVLTEVSFKLLPIPQTQATVILSGLSDDRAVAAMAAALGSPYDITGAAHMNGKTLLRLEGFAESVAYRAERLRDALGAFGDALIEIGDASGRWRAVRDVLPFADRPGAVWRLSLKPSDGPKAVAAIAPEMTIYDWGGGLVWLLMPDDGDAGAAAIRSAVERLGGHATLIRATEKTRRAVAPFHRQAAAVEALSAALRIKFDPAEILNPGIMA
jgi:glycolate oxidase FAD binding subunit